MLSGPCKWVVTSQYLELIRRLYAYEKDELRCVKDIGETERYAGFHMTYIAFFLGNAQSCRRQHVKSDAYQRA